MPDELAKLELHERLDEIIKRLDTLDKGQRKAAEAFKKLAEALGIAEELAQE